MVTEKERERESVGGTERRASERICVEAERTRMGRGTEVGLWDDSALLNAFDNAMSTYKMHGLGKRSEVVCTSSEATGEEKINGDQTCSNLVSVRDMTGNDTGGLDVANELGVMTQDYDTVNETQVSDAGHVTPFVGYSDPKIMEDYNKLVTEYYEIEEKRQAVLLQLQQLGAYDYQYHAQGSGYDAALAACSTSYSHTATAGQDSLPSAACYCCSCACYSSGATCPVSCCSVGVHCSNRDCLNDSLAVGPGKPTLGVDFLKEAVGAAEAAMSSLKMKVSGDSGIKDKDGQKDIEGDMSCSNTCETDLGMVLKAWFSAGLYTGKYLTEQSGTKK